GKKLVHVSLEDVPEKVTSYYKVILKDLLKVLKIENELELVALLEKNRMILAYLSQSFDIERLRDNLKNLVEYTQFMPNTLIIDGLDFEKAGRDLFEGFKGIALEFNTEIWFSALSHRHITDVNERGVPYPCNDLDDLFSIILQLQPTQSGISMRLLKDHESPVISDTGIRLDPNTFLVMG
ncbi:MAG: hypothetical protein SV375_18865, partial [Thermodesulfobacteriota bacterium]|nr:hypothetical protein [Thermodesulfobacteriota bacterium]